MATFDPEHYHKVLLCGVKADGSVVALEASTDKKLKMSSSNGVGPGGSTEVLIMNGSSQAVPVAGTVSVDNFPASQTVTDGGASLSVDDGAGSLTVDGTVALSTATLAALETVSVSNFPASQPVTGTVSVGNFPTVQPIREAPNVTTWVSVKSAAPAANSVQADTGQLAAGDYDFIVLLSASDTLAVGKGLVIEHRNAANNATLQSLGGISAGDSKQFEIRRYTIATNERIRVIAGTAAGTASSMYVSAIGRRIS